MVWLLLFLLIFYSCYKNPAQVPIIPRSYLSMNSSRVSSIPNVTIFLISPALFSSFFMYVSSHIKYGSLRIWFLYNEFPIQVLFFFFFLQMGNEVFPNSHLFLSRQCVSSVNQLYFIFSLNIRHR